MSVLSQRDTRVYVLEWETTRPRIDFFLLGAAFFGAAAWLGLHLL